MDGWLRSLENMVPVPPAHRGELVEWADALRVLRCSEPDLEAMVEHGLHCDERDGDRFFERADLYNVALGSRSDRSLPELGAVFIRRLSREGVSAWTQPRSWQVRIELRCPLGTGCGGGAWELARPAPSKLGGSDGEWEAEGTQAPPNGSLGAPSARGFFAVGGSFSTRGSQGEVVSKALTEAYSAVVREYRYQVLSRSWTEDLDALRAVRVADCAAAAGILADDCRAAGYDSEVDAGLLLGTFGFSSHRWVRVRDDDGEWKILEPTLPLLSKLGSDGDPAAAAAFTRFCCGSHLNRVVECEPLEGGGLSRHVCHDRRREPEVAVRARAERGGAGP